MEYEVRDLSVTMTDTEHPVFIRITEDGVKEEVTDLEHATLVVMGTLRSNYSGMKKLDGGRLEGLVEEFFDCIRGSMGPPVAAVDRGDVLDISVVFCEPFRFVCVLPPASGESDTMVCGSMGGVCVGA